MRKEEMDTEFWLCLAGNGGMESEKPSVPDVLHVSDGTDKERPLTTSKFVTEEANDPYYREVANATGKPGSVCSHDRNEVLIRQARIVGALQRFIPTSLHAHIIYLAHYTVLPGQPGEI